MGRRAGLAFGSKDCLMENVLIVAYLLIVLAMIAVILLQRSEGGGLGMSTSTNQFMTVRGSANLLTRTTAVLAALFFLTAIGLTILSELNRGSQSILDQAAQGDGSAPTTVLDALNARQNSLAGDLPVPSNTTAPVTEGGVDPVGTLDLATPDATDAGTGEVEAPETAPETPATTEPANSVPAAPVN
jgi:preprotein translocase subunit SecG